MVYQALLPLLPPDAHTTTASSRLNWRPPANLNGLVRFAERPSLVSARVPSRFKRALLYFSKEERHAVEYIYIYIIVQYDKF